MFSRHDCGNGLVVDLSSRPRPILSSPRWLFPSSYPSASSWPSGSHHLVFYSLARTCILGARCATCGAGRRTAGLLIIHTAFSPAPKPGCVHDSFFSFFFSFSLPHSHGRLGSIIVVFVVFMGVRGAALGGPLDRFLHSRRLNVRHTIDGKLSCNDSRNRSLRRCSYGKKDHSRSNSTTTTTEPTTKKSASLYC